MATTVGTAGALSQPRRRLFTQQTIEGYACILPWLVGFLCFVAGPMIAAFIISFLDWSLLALRSLVRSAGPERSGNTGAGPRRSLDALLPLAYGSQA